MGAANAKLSEGRPFLLALAFASSSAPDVQPGAAGARRQRPSPRRRCQNPPDAESRAQRGGLFKDDGQRPAALSPSTPGSPRYRRAEVSRVRAAPDADLSGRRSPELETLITLTSLTTGEKITTLEILSEPMC